jgi:hypothetical protein
MPDLNELFQQAAQAGVDLNDEKQAQGAFDALKKQWNGFYTALTNLGFGAAQSRFEKDLTAEKEAKTRAENEAKDLREKLSQKETPEIKQLNADWQTKFEAMKSELTTKLEQEKASTKGAWLSRDQETLARYLHDRGVPEAVAPLLAKDPELLPKRGEYADGSLTIFQAGQKIPFSPGEGQTVLSLLADEMVQRADIKKILEDRGDTGGGVTTGGNLSPATGDKAFFDGIRKTAQEEQKGVKAPTGLRERIASR